MSVNNNYIKSPLNYTGGKFKLLNEIIPLFPKKCNNFIDLFCGGCNVAINIKANNIICNDKVKPLIDLYNAIQNNTIIDIFNYFDYQIEKFNLNNHNKENYILFRKHYNITKNPLDLYLLLSLSFSNYIRFNSKLEFNVPFGKRCLLDDVWKNKLIPFFNKIHEITFINKDFTQIDLSNFNKNDYVFIDPPYLISNATYNDHNSWNEIYEKNLLNLIDNIKNDTNFMLTNFICHKDRLNEILINWIEQNNFNIKYLNSNYSNSASVNNKYKTIITQEVIIYNF